MEEEVVDLLERRKIGTMISDKGLAIMRINVEEVWKTRVGYKEGLYLR